MSVIIHKLLETQVSIKLYHWQTKFYSAHLESDKFVSSLIELIDQFVECYQGKYGRVSFNEPLQITLANVSEDRALNILQDLHQFLVSDLTKLLPHKDVDLLNIRDEITLLIKRTAYLLSFQ